MSTKTLTAPSARQRGERISLYYREGSSDKVYQASIEPLAGGFIVNFAYGRRGTTLQTGTKTSRPVPYEDAQQIYNKLVKEKRAKGYTPGADGTPYAGTDKQQLSTGILPQLLNAIEESELEPLLLDPRWWMQEKFDGKRILIRRTGSEVIGINRKGLVVGLPQPIVDAVLTLETKVCLLDGEAVGDVFHAFDVLMDGETDVRAHPYSSRYQRLIDLLDPTAPDALRYAPTATIELQKRSLLQKLKAEMREGIVLKDNTAVYSPGRPASGGTQLKLKFYATASCVVAGANKGKRSVTLELIDGKGNRVNVGSVTIPANQSIPVAGQIAEVRYLYAYPGGSLYQPVYLGVRDDAATEECTVAQLKFKSSDAEES